MAVFEEVIVGEELTIMIVTYGELVPLKFVAVKVALYVPAAAVPLITPVEVFNVSPVGKPPR